MPSVAFRVDASAKIGSGHFMRCLALADSLAGQGVQIRFVSRHLPEHFERLLAARGFDAAHLRAQANPEATDDLPHSEWLGTSQRTDARESIDALSDSTWNWLVVDHYALDRRWEHAVRSSASAIMIIDDLADRPHDCDLLLDQNLHADMHVRYKNHVPSNCVFLLGPRYALLRSEFAERRCSIQIRDGAVRRILVSMGGADLSDETTKVMRALAGLRTRLEGVDVVIGSQHPARERVRTISRQLSFECHIEPTSMAALMAGADVAIGGAGVTSWERCCLGLPAICISLAHNQVPIAKALEAQGAIVYLGDAATINDADIEVSVAALMARPDRVRGLSSAAHALVDGLGTRRVCEHLLAQP